MAVKMLMKGAVLPGNSTVELHDFEVPSPGHGQVLIQTKASTICGSDIRCIYREHTGKGPEGYICVKANSMTEREATNPAASSWKREKA